MGQVPMLKPQKKDYELHTRLKHRLSRSMDKIATLFTIQILTEKRQTFLTESQFWRYHLLIKHCGRRWRRQEGSKDTRIVRCILKCSS